MSCTFTDTAGTCESDDHMCGRPAKYHNIITPKVYRCEEHAPLPGVMQRWEILNGYSL